jgi:tight adherence protein C
MPAEYLPIAIAVTVFLSILLVIIGVVMVMRTSSRKQAFLQRSQTFGQEAAFGAPVAATTAPSAGLKGKILGLFGLLGQTVKRDKELDHTKLRPMFLKAGIRSDKAPSVFWGFKIALVVLLPLGFLLFRFLAPEVRISQPMSIGIFTLLAIAGFYLPNLWLSNKIQKRRQTILDGFPDALDLMVVCVEAGMGLDAAISRVAKESKSNNKILSDELHLFTLEIRAGLPRQDALKNLAMRTDLEEMQNLVTLLLQTDRFGTSVAQALNVYSETMRTQRFQRAEEKAAKIPIKLLFPLIMFIFPALFVAILGPAIISIIQTFSGL